VVFRILGNGDGFGFGREMGQLLVEFFSEEGHHGVEEPEGGLQYVEEGVGGQLHQLGVRAAEDHFGGLNVHITEVINEEVVEHNGRIAEVILVETLVDSLDGCVQLMQHPLVGEPQLGVVGQNVILVLEVSREVAQHEFATVPYFVAELFVAYDPFEVEVDVESLEHVGEQPVAQSI
jgi:hypothetical protein